MQVLTRRQRSGPVWRSLEADSLDEMRDSTGPCRGDDMRLAEEDSAPTDTDVSTKNRRCRQAYPRGKVIVHPGHRKAEYIEE
jgi:hypothetical protein